jgi:hypothetical protein
MSGNSAFCHAQYRELCPSFKGSVVDPERLPATLSTAEEGRVSNPAFRFTGICVDKLVSGGPGRDIFIKSPVQLIFGKVFVSISVNLSR